MTKTKTYKEDELPEKFAQRIGLKFNDPMLLCRALTHRSFLNEHPDAIEDNERLEFLGDAILDFIVGAWLYNELPEMPEGELTKYRAALVHTEQLAEFAKQIGLGQALRLATTLTKHVEQVNAEFPVIRTQGAQPPFNRSPT